MITGDGDLNQIRKAVINEYRRQADFELIVADSCRYSTSEDAEDYLRRAVQQHGSANTVLVLNKIDVSGKNHTRQIGADHPPAFLHHSN